MDKSITDRQLFFIIVASVTGGMVNTIPQAMAISSGTGTWFSLAITAIVFAVLASMIVYVSLRFSGQTIVQYGPKLLGNFISKIVIIILFVYGILFMSILARSITEMNQVEALPDTPIWATVTLLIGAAAYTATRELVDIARLTEVFGVLIIIMAIVIHTIMLFTGDFMYIRPVFDPSSVGNYFSGTWTAMRYFTGIEILFIIPLIPKSNKNGRRVSAITFLYIGIMYILICETSYMMVGIDEIVNFPDALMTAIRRVDIPSIPFLSRLDIIFYIIGTMAFFTAVSILIKFCTEFISGLFPRIKKNYLVFSVAALGLIIALVYPDMKAVDAVSNIVAGFFPLFTSIALPILLFVFAKVKKNVS